MANWCNNEIRFHRDLTEEEMIKIANAMGFKDDFYFNNGYICGFKIRPHMFYDSKLTLGFTERFKETLAGREIDLEELMTLFYQLNPLGLSEKDLLKFCLYLEINPELSSLMGLGFSYVEKLQKIYQLLSTYKDELLTLNIEKFEALKNYGAYSVDIDSFESRYMNLQTKWSPIGVDWFEKFAEKVAEVIDKETALEMTLYYEEPGNGVFGLYSMYLDEDSNKLYAEDDTNYSEYIEEIEEEEE